MSPALAATLGAIGGAILGSFVATVAIRWPEGLGIGGRSRCDHCGRPLGVLNLVPLVSCLAQRGRCGACGGKIAALHFGVELGCAGLGAALSWAVASLTLPPAAAAALALLGFVLMLAAAMDARALFLPRVLSLMLLAAGLAWGGIAWAPFGSELTLADRLLGAAVGGFALAAIAYAYQRARGVEGMGGGDPPFFAALGAWGGVTPQPFVLLLASLAGIAVALMRRLRGQPVDEPALPLGTLMALAFPFALWLSAGLRG